jgi:hypothetical protein
VRAVCLPRPGCGLCCLGFACVTCTTCRCQDGEDVTPPQAARPQQLHVLLADLDLWDRLPVVRSSPTPNAFFDR